MQTTVANVVCNADFVTAKLNSRLYVASFYVSLLHAISHFKDFLRRLEDFIRELGAGYKVHITSNFNAYSAAWSDCITNPRGDDLVAFTFFLGLVVVYEG